MPDELVKDLTQFYEPPWWRPLKRYRWKRNGPATISAALQQALFGDIEPIRRTGAEHVD